MTLQKRKVKKLNYSKTKVKARNLLTNVSYSLTEDLNNQIFIIQALLLIFYHF